MSRDIESFYRQIDVVLTTAADYVGSDYLRQLLISCRLKPLYAILGEKIPRNRLEKIWVDEWGGSIHLSHDKVETFLIEPLVDDRHMVTTDLFARLPMDRLIAFSRSVVLSELHFLFRGQDGYLRATETSGKYVSPLVFEGARILTFLPHMRVKEKLFEDSYALYRLPNSEIEGLIKGHNG